MIENAAYICLLGSTCTSVFSLPVGRTLLALSLVLMLVECVRERRLPSISMSAWLGFVWVLLAVRATVYGMDPECGVPKLDKLLWLAGIPVYATIVNSGYRLMSVLMSYCAGTAILCVKMWIRYPLQARELVADKGMHFMEALKSVASMTDAQRLMMGVAVSVGFLFLYRREGRRYVVWLVLLIAQSAALLMTFKRGSWICAAIIVMVCVAMQTQWRSLFVVAAVILVAALLPPVRGRLVEITREFDSGKGGRVTMWTKIAPELMRQYPWGIGYRSLSAESMQKVAKQVGTHVEPNRDHLHSNPVQVVVATGWLGLAVWLAWMGRAVLDTLRLARAGGTGAVETGLLSACWGRADEASRTRAYGWILFFMLVGLLLNGLVEYNFGDSELVLIYGLLIGCAVQGRRRVTPESGLFS